jgi:hypothetical protein
MLQNFLKSRFSTAVLISLALGLVVASGYVIAGGSGGFDNQTNNIGNVENFNVINPENPNADLGKISLGAGTYTENQDDIATSTTDAVGVNNLSIWDRVRYGDDVLSNKNSVTEKFLFKSFTAASTTLFAIQNNEGQPIYIQDIGLKFTGIPSSTMQFFVGTSTSEYVNRTLVEGVTDISSSGLCALMDDVLMTDGGTLDATNTVLWATEDEAGTFAGCANGFSADFRQVPIAPGAWIVGMASTTEYASGVTDGTKLGAGDYLDGKVYIKYRFMK